MKDGLTGRVAEISATEERDWDFLMNLNLKSAFLCSKAGVAVLTSAIAEEFKKYNITANCIVPSTIDTPENRLNFPSADISRWVRPEAIAAVVLFLVSDVAGVTSGALIPVFGKA